MRNLLILTVILFFVPSKVPAQVTIGNFIIQAASAPATPNNAMLFNGQTMLFNGSTMTFTHS